MRLIKVLLPSLATALVAPARPLTVTPARLAPLQAGAVADAEKLKVAPKLESPPVDSSGTLPKVNGGIVIGTRKLDGLDRWWRKRIGKHLIDRLPCSLLIAIPPEDFEPSSEA